MNRLHSDTDLSAVLDAAMTRLPVSLADNRARLSLWAVARRLPRILVSGPLGLEIRLSGPPGVDCFAAAIPGTAAFAALIAALRHSAPQAPWENPAQARALAAVLERWQRGEGPIPRVSRYLLLEMDAPADPAGPVAVPSLFLAPREARDFPRPGQPPNAFHRYIDATSMATAELSGVWPDPATARALADVVQAIPEGGDIFAVGAMLSRGAGAAMRVAVRRLDGAGIRAVLQAAGRSGQAEALLDCAGALAAARRDLHFEIGPGAETRVGLELSPAQDWKQASAQGWPELLQGLIRRGLVTADRVAAVLGLIDPGGEPLWGLAHVKVAADASGLLPVAKLYVGLLFAAAGRAGKDAGG